MSQNKDQIKEAKANHKLLKEHPEMYQKSRGDFFTRLLANKPPKFQCKLKIDKQIVTIT